MDAPLPNDFDPYEIKGPNWFERMLAAVAMWLFKHHVPCPDELEQEREEVDE